MLGAIQDILENLIKLAQFKSDSDRKVFETHVDPIYQDLKVIVANYHEILREIKITIQETVISPDSSRSIVSMLIERRREHEMTRAEVKRYANALKVNYHSKEIQEFATATFNLLNIEPVTVEMIQCFKETPPPKLKTATTSLIWDLSKVLPPSADSPRGALSLIRHYEKEIDDLWEAASQSYFELRTRYL
jgi:hypothetical protein